MLCLNETDKYKNDKQHKQQLKEAFNMVGLDIEMGKETDDIAVIFLKENQFHYRTQQLRLIPNKYETNALTSRHTLNAMQQ